MGIYEHFNLKPQTKKQNRQIKSKKNHAAEMKL